ncbi:hypothetical protein GPECTOR_5g62 [Gonium pectorale]|uniref:Sulfotransferase n=1 Tax=Gonium pectorale TaxID=33097 RepID=A0A150GWZ6_GONPE|nr:hypothetical protein GPECTOR_5g62 [Gonium pectorale]|eukprot:KXZ54407.1 hypothetical protein GPECTOR_5g62 [Gonium pectorale]
MDVQISSFGGVGSTQLSNHLNAYGITTNLLTDADALRHAPRPPAYPGCSNSGGGNGEGGADGRGGADGGRPAAPRHVVYLYGDPLAAVASHFRRGHACHQAQKTCGNPARLSPATFPASLAEYVGRGEDLFGLEAHFSAWMAEPVDYPVIMLRRGVRGAGYERMFEPEVAAALFRTLCAHKLPPDRIRDMAAAFSASKRKRRSEVSLMAWESRG